MRAEEAGKASLKKGKAFVKASEQQKKGGDGETNFTTEVRGFSKVRLE